MKKGNALFDNDEHHDSHEYLNWMLDSIHENYIGNESARNKEKEGQVPRVSFVSDLFAGTILNTFTCVTCEATNSREE